MDELTGFGVDVEGGGGGSGVEGCCFGLGGEDVRLVCGRGWWWDVGDEGQDGEDAGRR